MLYKYILIWEATNIKRLCPRHQTRGNEKPFTSPNRDHVHSFLSQTCLQVVSNNSWNSKDDTADTRMSLCADFSLIHLKQLFPYTNITSSPLYSAAVTPHLSPTQHSLLWLGETAQLTQSILLPCFCTSVSECVKNKVYIF